MINFNQALSVILTAKKGYVDLGYHEITDQDLSKICENILDNPDIQKIGLWRNYITDDGIPHIINMLINPFCVIKHINLANNKITQKGIQQLLDLLPQLQRNIIIELKGNPGFNLHAETYLNWRKPELEWW